VTVTRDTVETIAGRLFTGEPMAVADPYALYQAARLAGPVFAGPGREGQPGWHVVRHAEAVSALRDPRLSSKVLLGGAESDVVLAQMLVSLDPPAHTRVRRLMHKAFTPRTVAALRERISSIVDSLLDAAESAGCLDVIANLADPLPTQVIAAFLGAPESEWGGFKRWSKGLMTLGPPPADAFDRGREMGFYLWGMVAERRERPRDDLISALVAARDRGEVLTDPELVAQCIMLLVGGHETTTYAIGSSVLALLARPSVWAAFGRLAPASAAMARAVDEMLRYEPPFQFVGRTAREDFEIGEQQISAGERVWIWVGAANRDPDRFEHPDDLDLAREPNPHVTFGHGIHTCLGAALARLNLEIALAKLRHRYPDLALTDEPVQWRSDLGIRGPEKLPVRLPE
jgi:pimeloyl-[acyl-carrier protein] synthase